MIKLKQKLIMYASGLLFLLTGCIQDGFFGNIPGEDDPLTFTFTVDGITTNSATRATVSPINDETTVETLHLLFFEASEDMSGALAGVISLPSDPIVPTEGKLTMETSYILPSTGALNASGNYNIIGIANLGSYVENVSDWILQWKNEPNLTEEYFRDNATIIVSGTDNESDYSTHRPIKFNQLLMNGFVSKTTNTKNIQMVLSRNVARFDVVNEFKSTPLKTVSIWNAFTESSITGDAILNYSSESLHTKRLYGINTSGDIVTGGLYSFANYSEAPTINDKTTTNLIVGLDKEGARRYYRINVYSIGSPQVLKNNYAYKITIKSVNGDGYPTEEEAWEGTTNQLVYDVNFWGVDDNGLIVSDEFSLLAVPVKTAKFGKEGGENSYTINTFSTLENPEPLRIKNSFFEPADGNISAQIINGNLLITAQPMSTGETKRSGILTISFAGLETSVNVLQTADSGIYLEVTLDDGWKEFLPPTANAMTEYIIVNASGPWTARLYGSKNFALENFMSEYVSQISSSDYPNNKFHVYTSSANESNAKVERGFVLISLDSDPTNYISVVPVNQSPKGGIDTQPEIVSEIRFHASGSLETTSGNQMSSETQYRFKVLSQGTIAANNVRLTGANYDKFDFTYDVSTGYITVWAKGTNIAASPYRATLSVSDNKNGTLYVSLFQGTNTFSLIPPSKDDPVDVKGGKRLVKISIGDPSVSWTATVETKTNGDKAIFNHNAVILKKDGVTKLGSNSTNEDLWVQFPKVYYPNRGTEIKAVVTVETSSGNSVTFEVHQKALVAKDLRIWSSYSATSNYSWGSLGNLDYFNGFINRLNAKIKAEGHIGGLSSVLDMGKSVSSVYPSSNHVWLHQTNYDGDNTVWSKVNSLYDDTNNEALFVFMMTSNNEGFKKANAYNKGYTYGAHTRPAGTVRLNQGVNTSRIYQFIIKKGNLSFTSPNNLTFYNDGYSTSVSGYPSYAVPILDYSGGGYNLVIDPKNKMIFMGDEAYFTETGVSPNNPNGHYNYLNYEAPIVGGYKNYSDRSAFINNLIDYMLLAAKYGSHFTDMLIDYKVTDENPVSEPWSEDWGVNAWPN